MVTLSTMSGYDNSAHNTRNLHRDGSGFTAQSLCRFQKESLEKRKEIYIRRPLQHNR